MSLPLIAMTPETLRSIVNTHNHGDAEDLKLAVYWARVYAVLYGVRAYNDGDINAMDLHDWLGLAFDAEPDIERLIGACLG